MSRSAVRALAAVMVAAALGACSGGDHGSTAPAATPTPVNPAPTLAKVPTHDLAVALRKVLGQAVTESNSTNAELRAAATLDQAAQTMGDHAAAFNAQHQTLEQLPPFPIAQTQNDVKKLSADLAGLSSVISAMLAAEFAEYSQYRPRIYAQIAVVNRDLAMVGNELRPY
jgi:hypothetical protein